MDTKFNVLAVKLGQEQDLGNGSIDTGERALLAVTNIVADVQATTFFGNSLYLIWYNVGQLDCCQAFTFFVEPFYNKPMVWSQLEAPPPNPLIGSSLVYLGPQVPTPEPVAEGPMILLNSGYDPLKGFWLTFKGNYDYVIPIFQDWSEFVKRNIPNYQIREG